MAPAEVDPAEVDWGRGQAAAGEKGRAAAVAVAMGPAAEVATGPAAAGGKGREAEEDEEGAA